MLKSSYTNTVIVYENFCSSCKHGFDNEKRTPIKLECGHAICAECWKPVKIWITVGSLFTIGMECRFCSKFTHQPTIDQTRFISSRQAVKNLTENLAKSEQRITFLSEKVEEEFRKVKELEEGKRELECRAGAVNCSECGSVDNEKNIQVCNTCSLKSCIDLEKCRELMASNDLETKSIAICSTCAIRNHMKKGHSVNNLFPLMRYIQYTLHYANLEPKRERVEETYNELKSSIDTMWETIDDERTELDKMTGMLRRSKTSDLQQKLVDRIGVEIVKHREFVEKFNKVVEDMSGSLRKEVVELKSKNEYEESTGIN